MADFWDEFDDDSEEENYAAEEETAADLSDEELADAAAEDTADSEDAYDNDEATSVVAGAEEDEEDLEEEEEEMATTKRPPRRGKKAAGKSKAEWIRDEITRRRDKGESLRPKDILQSLADKGVTVVAPQVSIALRDMGLRTAREPVAAGNGADGKSRTARRVKPPAGPASESGEKLMFSADELQAAHDFVAHCGGLRRTHELLSAIARAQLKS